MSLEWVAICLVGGSLTVSTVTLFIAWRVLRSTRRSERAGDERLEILREQQQRLKLWGEERRLLLEELERQRSVGNGAGPLLELPAHSASERPKLWRWWRGVFGAYPHPIGNRRYRG
jgi:hypothetical protein